MTFGFAFDNSYASLPERAYARLGPTGVPAPRLIALNAPLARELGLDPAALATPEGVAVLAGNALPEGAAPIAQAYAGHQFGNWVPQLGDGRAILLGEVLGDAGRRDIVLKGAGPTPWSRGGDGRAWLGPVLREYIVSEAMHAYGIPTTRALAVVETGAQVMRQTPLPGAILTRVAASHIRIGTFQYFFNRGDTEMLRALYDHVRARHYPGASDPLDLLSQVVAAQARLVAQWMSVGFIHGVMNTDNMSLSGETIDYGPCAFMDVFDPRAVFSSIDQFARYAYHNQPRIAAWNLAQFASCLIPLMEGREGAIQEATQIVHNFPRAFDKYWAEMFRAKIGLANEEDGDIDLISSLLERMAEGKADFTRTFRRLICGHAGEEFSDPALFGDWEVDWRARLARSPGEAEAIMSAANPTVIPRNHMIEQVIQEAQAGDYALFHRLNETLARPFDPLANHDAMFFAAPRPEQVVAATFCGT